MDPIIKTTNLTKYYGKIKGIENINLEVYEGEIFGFLGPNGAGKTTTIRLLLDLIHPTRGKASIFSLDSVRNSHIIRKRVGYLPGEIGFYGNITGAEFLDYCSSFYNLDQKEMRNNLLEKFKLDLNRKIKSYSKGMRQKLGIIQAFIHNPDLLILDEPTSGLDPLNQQLFYELLKEEKDNGKTIFLSSHILSEVEKECTRVCIIKDGNIVTVQDIEELKRKRGKVIEVTLEDDLLEKTFQIEGVDKIVKEGLKFKIYCSFNLNEVIKIIASHTIVNMTIKDTSLEEIFFDYYI